VAGLAIACSRGIDQDRVNMREYQQYISAEELARNNSIDKAMPVFKSLAERHPDSHALLYKYGLCLSNQGDYVNADKFLNKAMLARPAFLQEPVFLVQYGYVHFMRGRYSEAEVYLSAALEANPEPDMRDKIKIILRGVADKQKVNKGGRG
jgi:tetratricopeptide (TPR) repeat protein